jgi:hypothetical protein
MIHCVSAINGWIDTNHINSHVSDMLIMKGLGRVTKKSMYLKHFVEYYFSPVYFKVCVCVCVCVYIYIFFKVTFHSCFSLSKNVGVRPL